MISFIQSFLDTANSWLWGFPIILILFGTGLYLTIKLRGLQFSKLRHALSLAFIKRHEAGEGDISHFQALMTALAATVGTGNIVGVATAIYFGGPGALFWMWITGLFGMALKYSEALLAVKYRVQDEKGEFCGGPMYYLERGLNLKWLGVFFAFATAIAAFGIGNMVQANAIANVMKQTFSIAPYVTGSIIAILAGMVIIGGIKEIAKVTSFLVPFMVVVYVIACLIILFFNITKIPGIFVVILHAAFTGEAARGSIMGVAVMFTVRYGFARGIFSNESGMGSAPIAAAAARCTHPVSQALVSMTQTFIDTIIVCTMTGFCIIITGMYITVDNPAVMTAEAFNTVFSGGLGGMIVAVSLMLFAFSTIIGWYYYGEKAVEYLCGLKIILPYKILWCVFVVIGASAKLKLVWDFSDFFNGMMIIPNLIALILLSKVIVSETNDYFSKERLSE